MLYRIHKLGFRKFESGAAKGCFVPQGHIIEKFDNEAKIWVYLDCIHPNDARDFITNRRRFTFVNENVYESKIS